MPFSDLVRFQAKTKNKTFLVKNMVYIMFFSYLCTVIRKRTEDEKESDNSHCCISDGIM